MIDSLILADFRNWVYKEQQEFLKLSINHLDPYKYFMENMPNYFGKLAQGGQTILDNNEFSIDRKQLIQLARMLQAISEESIAQIDENLRNQNASN
jgi:hypothetical protein